MLAVSIGRGQQPHPAVKTLSPPEVATVISDTVKSAFRLNLPISRVYKYSDNSGTYFCVLMESNDSIGQTEGKTDTFSRNIKAVDLKQNGNGFTKVWELNDHIVKNDQKEYAIWFWNSYFSFEDFDGDGLVDPFLVYGTWGDDQYENGRIKFIIYLRGKKFAMRHQSSTFDEVRSTEFDPGFNDSIPKKLHDGINARIARIQKEKHGYFYPLP